MKMTILEKVMLVGRATTFCVGLAVINAGILFKIAWTFVISDVAGALSHLPAAVLGLTVCNAVILWVMRRLRKEPASLSIRQANQHGG